MESNSDNNETKKMKYKPSNCQSILEKAVLSKLTFPPAASFGSDMQTTITDDGAEILLTMEKDVWKEVYANYDLPFLEGEKRRFFISDTLLEKEGHEFFFLYRYRKSGGNVVDFHIYIEKESETLSSIFDIKLSPEVAVFKNHKDLWVLSDFSLQKVDGFDNLEETSSLIFRKYQYHTLSEAVCSFLMSLGKTQDVLDEAEHLLNLTQAQSFCSKNFEDLLQEHQISKIIPNKFNETTGTFEINLVKNDSVYFMIYQTKEGKFWLFLQQDANHTSPYVTWCDYYGENKEVFVADVLSPYWKENKKKRKRRAEDEEHDKVVVNRKLNFSPKNKNPEQKIPDDISDSFQTPEKRKTDEGDYSNSDMLVVEPN